MELLPDQAITSAYPNTSLPDVANWQLDNGTHSVSIPELPDGSYKLLLNAPQTYFREPQGYLFQVSQGSILWPQEEANSFSFILTPLTDHTLPACRDVLHLSKPLFPEASQNDAGDPSSHVCQAERLIDLSGFRKQSEAENSSGVRSTGYHYAGPETTSDSGGVRGRNTVVDADVAHSSTTEFVAERVYAANGSSWIEAGWAEVSWRDNHQYIYEYDYNTRTWHWFDQFQLSSGSKVETYVYYQPSNSTWYAHYYAGGGWWAQLAAENLGVSYADRGYNRAEIYTDYASHPYLPRSRFDVGRLWDGGGWQTWTTSYSTSVGQDSPYSVDMYNQYYNFDVYYNP